MNEPYDKRFRIPNFGEDPTDEMVEFLNENHLPWDGDESGIRLTSYAGGKEYEVIGEPGDYVVRGFAMDYYITDKDGLPKEWICCET